MMTSAILVLAIAILGLLGCFASYHLGFGEGQEHQHQRDMCELRDKIAPSGGRKYSDD